MRLVFFATWCFVFAFGSCYAQVPDTTDSIAPPSPVIDSIIDVTPDPVALDRIDTQSSNEGDAEATRRQTRFFHRLPYLFDDLLVIGGVSQNGLYYTRNFRELGHTTGWQIGVENYYPVFDRAFLHYGFIYSERGFAHTARGVEFTKTYFDVPLFLSYELPELEFLDWRLIMGAKFSYMLEAGQSGEYSDAVNGDEFFRYDRDDFHNLDWGFFVGFSFEKKDFYLRVSAYTGVVKLVPQDQGMRSSFSLDLGYFLFRGLREL